MVGGGGFSGSVKGAWLKVGNVVSLVLYRVRLLMWFSGKWSWSRKSLKDCVLCEADFVFCVQVS